MTAPARRLAALGVALFCVLCIFIPTASAQPAGRAEVRAWLDVDSVAADEVFAYHLSAMTTSGSAPSDWQAGNLQGLPVLGTSASPTTSISIVNGSVSQRHGVSVTWTLRATKPGTYTLGPASIVVGGKRVQAEAQTIRVVARGAAAGRPKPGAAGIDPFDTWKSLFGDDPTRDVQEPETAPDLALDAARAPGAFLHAVVDKSKVMVGEQVTHSVYLYVDPLERQGEVEEKHEASAPDFLRHPIVEAGRGRVVGRARVGSRTWTVHLWRQTALFPLKAGDLVIGTFQIDMVSPRGAHDAKESEKLTVKVAEPPAKGRPAGYAVGDVGRFKLSADVTPRETIRGGTVGVTVELSGEGNLPRSLPLPPSEGPRAGVEWLEPQTRDKLGVVRDDRFGGKRTFSYVARMGREGAVDLGAIELPYWSTETASYQIARVALGTVQVAPGSAAPAASAAPADEKLAALPRPATAREPAAAARPHLADRPWFWSLLGVGPLAYVVARAGHRASASLRERRARALASPSRDLEQKTKRAAAALAAGDGRGLAGAIEAMLSSACILHVKVDVRGVAGDAAVRELVDAGVPEGDAFELRSVLDACQGARFAPEGTPMPEADALFGRAKTLVAALAKRGGRA